ncbi:hypothetical protein [Nocardia panacis]|nr:hypothetical protein [Nocardia panacis]
MSEDPDLAQARVLLDALAAQLVSLNRALDVAQRNGRAAEVHALTVDLRTVDRYIERLHRRFPQTQEVRP